MIPLYDSLGDRRIAALREHGVEVETIGYTEGGRELHGCTVGPESAPVVSIVAGAHPDEPAGPLAALSLLASWRKNPLRDRLRLAVVPLMDVDGVAAQRDWLDPWQDHVDVPRYVQHRLRRKPGRDREFAWPGAPWGGTVLPECRAANTFLDDCGPPIAHMSLHGMAVADGCWFLLDGPATTHPGIWRECREVAERTELGLHEFFRYGDKGFRRMGRGFCTAPNGPAMRRWALAQGDSAMAAGFGYGSMDAARLRARKHGAPEPFIGVSEAPLIRSTQPAPPKGWGELVGAIGLADDPEAMAQQTIKRHGLQPVSLGTQVAAIRGMVEAVMAAAVSATDG